MRTLQYRQLIHLVCAVTAAQLGCTGRVGTGALAKPPSPPIAGKADIVHDAAVPHDAGAAKPTGTDGGGATANASGGSPAMSVDAGNSPSANDVADASLVRPPVSQPIEAPLSGKDAEFTKSAGGKGLDVLADPSHPGTFYAFMEPNLAGSYVFKSLDWGASFARIDTDAQLSHGTTWGQAIAPDGSYMLASVGYPDNGNQGAWKSTDGGVTWRAYKMSQDNDPYNFDVDPSDAKHVIAAMHAAPNIFESMDGGETWRDRGSAGTGGSNYVFFITSTTWLSLPQDGESSGTKRTTDSGATWKEVCSARHAHGNAQIFIDRNTGYIYIAGHNDGLHRSTDGGATFKQVSSLRASVVFATARYIYAMDPGANSSGTPALPQRSARSDGVTWTAFDAPSEMNNGMKRAAVAYDEKSDRWVIVGGNWYAGTWRYIEPK